VDFDDCFVDDGGKARGSYVRAVRGAPISPTPSPTPTVTPTPSVTPSPTPEVISVSVAPDFWTIGGVAIEGTTDWSFFTATNDGNTIANFSIKGEAGAGAWLIQSEPGTDIFAVDVDDPELNLTTEEQPLGTEVAPAAVKGFGLRYKSPTADTKGALVNQDFDITINATKPD